MLSGEELFLRFAPADMRLDGQINQFGLVERAFLINAMASRGEDELAAEIFVQQIPDGASSLMDRSGEGLALVNARLEGRLYLPTRGFEDLVVAFYGEAESIVLALIIGGAERTEGRVSAAIAGYTIEAPPRSSR